MQLLPNVLVNAIIWSFILNFLYLFIYLQQIVFFKWLIFPLISCHLSHNASRINKLTVISWWERWTQFSPNLRNSQLLLMCMKDNVFVRTLFFLHPQYFFSLFLFLYFHCHWLWETLTFLQVESMLLLNAVFICICIQSEL